MVGAIGARRVPEPVVTRLLTNKDHRPEPRYVLSVTRRVHGIGGRIKEWHQWREEY